MSGVAGKRRFTSVIEAIISEKGLGIKENTAATFRMDAAIILESLLAELSDENILAALRNHGVSPESYRSTLDALSKLARSRRMDRLAGAKKY